MVQSARVDILATPRVLMHQVNRSTRHNYTVKLIAGLPLELSGDQNYLLLCGGDESSHCHASNRDRSLACWVGYVICTVKLPATVTVRS